MYIQVRMQRRSSPIVLRANHFQFGPGEQHSFGPVKSCMQLWCRAGRGVVSTADTELELVAGRVLLLPWGHRIRYEANKRKPFLVSGVHIVPAAAHGLGRIPFGQVSHHGENVPGMTEGQHSLGHEAHLFEEREASTLAHLGDYIVSVFTRSEPVEEEQRLLARLLLHEWRLLLRQKSVPRASPDLGLLELYVRDHLEARLDLATLSRVLEVSPSSVHRLVRRASGLSPAAWVQRLRIEEARRRLAGNRRGLAELATNLGFCDEFHFSRVFKRHTGETPRAWRARHSLL